MKLLQKILLGLAALTVLYVGGILLFGSLTDWQPTETEPLEPSAGQTAAEPLITDSVVSLLTWNVGYGGIGDQDFFFYNKGDFFWTNPGTVRMSRERVEGNVFGQEATIKAREADIYLLQEIDTAARRSHYTNQLATARSARPDYAAFFAANFKSKRVPLPLLQPWDHYGYVVGGLVSLARFQPSVAERIQLPGAFPWPTRLFQLDRCALRQVFPVAGGKELAVYNIHLSAYDKGGGIRQQQMNALREAVLADYAAGRYVIVGGDWNQLPPGFNWFTFNPTVDQIEQPKAVGFDFMPLGWTYAYDPSLPTVRSSDTPYDAHRSLRSLIDFYLLSPNLRIQEVQGVDQSFMFSDHQPVFVRIELL